MVAGGNDRVEDMVIPVLCPDCKHMARFPRKLAGRKVICPRCENVLRVPRPKELVKEERPPASAEKVPDQPLTWAAKLGILALALALLSVLVLCLPLVGYASVVLSGGGLLLGLGGLVRSLHEDGGQARRLLAGPAGTPSRSRSVWTFPLVGTVACLLALALALLPLLVWE